MTTWFNVDGYCDIYCYIKIDEICGCKECISYNSEYNVEWEWMNENEEGMKDV